MTRHTRYILLGIAVIGVSLRFLLYWVNPPLNAFDNHLEPIHWIMHSGEIPPKDALWQSYQPPVFYVISSFVGRFFLLLGGSSDYLDKVLQLMPCLYGILTLWFIFLILRKLPISDVSRIAAFSVVCFLPRHIYMGALHSNDTFASLAVTASIYLLLVTREKKYNYTFLILTSVILTTALFTKYTAFVVLPAALFALAPVFSKQLALSKLKAAAAAFFLAGVPFASLAVHGADNYKSYGEFLPWNDSILAPSETQPRAPEGISYMTFKPWESIQSPILTPSNLGSFWTLVHARMWFDVEPKFLYFTDPNVRWWSDYYRWLRGELEFPHPIQLSPETLTAGRILIGLGLLPVSILLFGLCRSIVAKESTNMLLSHGFANSLLISVLLFNVIGVLTLSLISPVYSSIKAAYFMNSLAAMAVFVGLGCEFLGKKKVFRWVNGLIMVLCCIVVTGHIFHIGRSLNFQLGNEPVLQESARDHVESLIDH